MMNALRERLAVLAPRERIVLAGGALLALLIALYATVWQPWQKELDRLRAQVPQQEADLAWMRAQAGNVETLAEQSTRRSTQSGLPLLTLIERSANQLDLRGDITRMSPGEEADQVRLWMDDADFDAWLRWLSVLSDNGVVVAEANIDRASDNRVNIRTTLQR